MKIVVVSDSHGDTAILEKIALIHQDASIFYHLGDSELPPYVLYGYGYASVKGNCDYEPYVLNRDVTLEGFKIHMEHGHGFSFQSDPNKYVENLGVDIFLFGHTHRKLATYVGNTLVFNPGSLTRPRDGEKGSYLVLDLKKGEKVKYKFYEVD